MRSWGRVLTISAVIVIAGCSAAPKEVDPDKTGERVSLKPTGTDLRRFSNQLANALRGEPFFVKAVSDMRDKLGEPPNVGFSKVGSSNEKPLDNNTTYDNLNLESVYNGFQEAFYASEKVTFTNNMPNLHLRLEYRLTEHRTYGANGEVIADYTGRVRVHELVLSDDPDAPAVGQKLIGSVSDNMTIRQDKTVF